MTGTAFNSAASNKSVFEVKYLEFLKNIIAGNEEVVNYAVRPLEAIMADDTKIPSQADIVAYNAFKELKVAGFGYLRGDLHSNSKSPWIRDIETLSMIDRHVHALGNEQDVENLNAFMMKTRSFYNIKTSQPDLRVA